MTERRPLPDYGEYATPEQQARAAGRTYVPQQNPSVPAAGGVPAVPVQSSASWPEPVVPAGVAEAEDAAPDAQRSQANRFATIAMLIVGLVVLLDSVPADVDFSAQLNAVGKQFGLGTFALPSLADRVGLGLLVVNLVLFVITAMWSFRRLAGGRRSFHIPIIGFVVYSIVYFVAFYALIAADPVFLGHLESVARSYY